MATIKKRGKSWFVQIRRKGFAPKYRSFATKSDALHWARLEESAIDTGHIGQMPTAIARAPLRIILQRYREEISVKKRGYESENLRLKRMQSDPLCDLAVTDLSPAALASYRNRRLNVVKPSTVKRELGVLRHALEIARREWGVPLRSNPIDTVALPKALDARQRRLREGEADRIVRALETTRNDLIAPIFKFAIATAMRRGEILNLKWQDISITNRHARITQSKNGHGRTIPLTSAAIAILESLPRSDEFVFPISGNAIRQSWTRVCSRAGIVDLRFHDLRHEAISRFCELGLSIPEVSLISGHKDPRMLFRYTHLLPAQVNARIDQLTRYLDEPQMNK